MIGIVIGGLIALLAASGWIAYGITLRVIQQRDEERERYKKALELAHVRAEQEIYQAREEAEALQDEVEASFARGKQEGKRATLAWIRQQVDDGALEVKVVGEALRKQ